MEEIEIETSDEVKYSTVLAQSKDGGKNMSSANPERETRSINPSAGNDKGSTGPRSSTATTASAPSTQSSSISSSKPIVTTHYFDEKDLPGKCIVPSCLSGRNPHFSFPNDAGLCSKWLQAIPKQGWSLNDDSAVCSIHFASSDIVGDSGKETLRDGSLPQLYLNNAPPNVVPPTNTSSIDSNCDTAPTIIGLDDDDGSDLELIEPEYPMVEISSDEESSPTATNPPQAPAKVHNYIAIPVNQLKKKSHSNVAQRCVVPTCMHCMVKRHCNANVTFHPFPRRGETQLKLQTPKGGVIIQDKHDFWMQLISVSEVPDNAVICSKHFTSSQFTAKRDLPSARLIKSAIPTQYLPRRTRTMGLSGPTRCEPELVPVSNHPLVMVASPAASSVRPTPGTTVSSSVPVSTVTNTNASLRIAPASNNPSSKGTNFNLPLVVGQPSNVSTLAQNRSFAPSAASVLNRGAAQSGNLVSGSVSVPVSAKTKIITWEPSQTKKFLCSIDGCPNQTPSTSIVLFKLPSDFDRCKAWIYACGHPEWLDSTENDRLNRRICTRHFPPEVFVDNKRLKGTALPILHVPKSYPKCIVKCCKNYFDKTRLHLIGVDFEDVPKEPERLAKWEQQIKKSYQGADPFKSDPDSLKKAVICTSHFREADFVITAEGKKLNKTCVPSLNLVNGPSIAAAEVPSEQPAPTVALKTYSSVRGRARGRGRGRSRGRGGSARNDTSPVESFGSRSSDTPRTSPERRSSRTSARAKKNYRCDSSDSEPSESEELEKEAAPVPEEPQAPKSPTDAADKAQEEVSGSPEQQVPASGINESDRNTEPPDSQAEAQLIVNEVRTFRVLRKRRRPYASKRLVPVKSEASNQPKRSRLSDRSVTAPPNKSDTDSDEPLANRLRNDPNSTKTNGNPQVSRVPQTDASDCLDDEGEAVQVSRESLPGKEPSQLHRGMVKKCRAKNCPVTSVTHPGELLHCFPSYDMIRFRQWCEIAEFESDGYRIWLFLCQRHFKISDYCEKSGKKVRRPRSDPVYRTGTLHPTYRNYCPPFQTEENARSFPKFLKPVKTNDERVTTVRKNQIAVSSSKRAGTRSPSIFDDSDEGESFLLSSLCEPSYGSSMC